jgi:hypothetical protein
MILFCFQPYEWNEIAYHYDGSTFTAEINGNTISERLLGGIETSSNPMFIGGCPQPGSGFNGLIDDVSIYIYRETASENF